MDKQGKLQGMGKEPHMELHKEPHMGKPVKLQDNMVLHKELRMA